jgi:hypothetical protein
MANPEITNIDPGNPVIDGRSYEDGLLTFAGADIFLAGTLLARNTSTQKFIPYVKGGSSNGNGVPRAVLTHRVERSGAGDTPVRVLTGGDVHKHRLIVDLVGDDSSIDGNVRDLLRQTGIFAEDTQQLNRYDNPQPAEGDS